MFNTISWQQYSVAVLSLTTAWYTYVGLGYYQPEILRLLRIKSRPYNPMPEVAHEVMGAIKPETGTSLNDPGELIFGLASEDGISDQTIPKGPADELRAEAEILISAFEENDDKKGFLSLLKTLVSQYEVFGDEISLPGVISELKTAANKLPFQIKASEWPITFKS